MVIGNFHFAKMPEIFFGEGEFLKIHRHDLVQQAKHILLVVGGRSFKESDRYISFCAQVKNEQIKLSEISVSQEPSPRFVDEQVELYKDKAVDLIVAVGGGSVMDAGKAISAMLLQTDSVMAYLEGVGAGKKHNGLKVPLIAVPTTSGTGSEATKNAVLSDVSKLGYKKSLRHDRFVPDVAILDPKLMVSCPPFVTASTGLDALTQLMGAYLSTKATLLTDALAINGIEQVGRCFIPACTTMGQSVEMRSGMAYASLMSGIVLANAGLGIVHGFASSIGGYFDIPHGVVCGTLLPEAVKMNIQKLRDEDNKENPYLSKYAFVGSLLTGTDKNDIEGSCDALVDVLEQWVCQLEIPKMSYYGITEKDLDRIVEITENKNNPVVLTKEEMKKILRNRL